MSKTRLSQLLFQLKHTQIAGYEMTPASHSELVAEDVY